MFVEMFQPDGSPVLLNLANSFLIQKGQSGEAIAVSLNGAIQATGTSYDIVTAENWPGYVELKMPDGRLALLNTGNCFAIKTDKTGEAIAVSLNGVEAKLGTPFDAIAGDLLPEQGGPTG